MSGPFSARLPLLLATAGTDLQLEGRTRPPAERPQPSEGWRADNATLWSCLILNFRPQCRFYLLNDRTTTKISSSIIQLSF
jgi:hypothetical protein